MGSEGATALSSALNTRRIYPDVRTNYRWRAGDVIICWGVINTQAIRRLSVIPEGAVLNPYEATTIAANKLLTFKRLTLHNVPVPQWTNHPRVAQDWNNAGNIIYARTVLTGTCGDGILLYQPSSTVGHAPLYTIGYKAKREYRVHVVRGQVIDFVKKGKRRERVSDPDPLIRNHENGWIFIRDGVELPECVKQAAIDAVDALGLDFGAVDIGWNDRNTEQPCVVYEVNTAPGFEQDSLTCGRYAHAFREIIS